MNCKASCWTSAYSGKPERLPRRSLKRTIPASAAESPHSRDDHEGVCANHLFEAVSEFVVRGGASRLKGHSEAVVPRKSEFNYLVNLNLFCGGTENPTSGLVRDWLRPQAERRCGQNLLTHFNCFAYLRKGVHPVPVHGLPVS